MRPNFCDALCSFYVFWQCTAHKLWRPCTKKVRGFYFFLQRINSLVAGLLLTGSSVSSHFEDCPIPLGPRCGRLVCFRKPCSIKISKYLPIEFLCMLRSCAASLCDRYISPLLLPLNRLFNSIYKLRGCGFKSSHASLSCIHSWSIKNLDCPLFSILYLLFWDISYHSKFWVWDWCVWNLWNNISKSCCESLPNLEQATAKPFRATQYLFPAQVPVFGNKTERLCTIIWMSSLHITARQRGEKFAMTLR